METVGNRRFHLHVQGWLDFPQSLSIINRFQCLSWARRADLRLSHEELPSPPAPILLSGKQWVRRPGMLASDLEARPEKPETLGPGEAPDAVFRIGFPYDFRETPGIPTFVFCVTEYHFLAPLLMASGRHPTSDLGPATRIVTPSQWSRQGLINSGLPPDRIHVVPHGIDPRIHRPARPEERERIRGERGWGGEMVYLAMGSLHPRKGTDVLLAAFARVARRHPDTRMVIKGIDEVYDSRSFLARHLADLPEADRALVEPRLEYLGETLGFEGVARLFRAADVLVSPYRAEGFNMPVLEALACGLPVICTGGGPTDEFTRPEFAWRVQSRPAPAKGRIGTWLEPDIDHLVSKMDEAVERRADLVPAGQAGASFVAAHYTWDAVSDRLLEILTGRSGDPVAPHPPSPLELRRGWTLWKDFPLRSAGFSIDTLARLTSGGIERHLRRRLDLEARLSAVVETTLQHLHSRTPMEDREARKIWLKAQRTLRRGRRPDAPPGDPALVAQLDVIDQLRDELSAARVAWESSFQHELAESRGRLDKALRDPRFEEAISWQGPHLTHSLLARLPSPEQTDSRAEYRRTMGLRFLQRYAAKNDTIGFFGPLAWCELDHEVEGARVEHGKHLLADRQLYFEYWAVDALATAITLRPGLRAQLAPRLAPHLRLVSDHFLVDKRGRRRRLGPGTAQILAACDGSTSAAEIARRLARGRVEAVLGRLERLARRRIIVWRLTPPVSMRAEIDLRNSLDLLGDSPDARTALSMLDELEGARARVASARAEPDRLREELGGLQSTFERLTGVAARRNPGKSYGARTLVFEECRRDVTFELGTRALDPARRALELVLRSARWYAVQIGLRLDRVIVRHLAGKRAGAVPLGRILHELSERVDHICRAVAKQVRHRWASILRPDLSSRRMAFASSSLEEAVDASFPAGELSWPGARVHTVDLMIAAPSLSGLEAGAALWVLGEVHPGGNLLMQQACLSTHPSPASLQALASGDPGWDAVSMVLPRRRDSHRTCLDPGLHALEIAQDESTPWHPARRVVRLADLVVRLAGGRPHVIDITTRRSFPIQEMYGMLGGHVMRSSFSLLPKAPHLPRITIDGLVVARESWTLPLTEFSTFADLSASERFYALRRLQDRAGAGRYNFVRLPGENKPVLVDMENPYSVESFLRMVRAAARFSPDGSVTLAEMLPGPSECWLTDADGARYTSELRMVLVDGMRWVPRLMRPRRRQID